MNIQISIIGIGLILIFYALSTAILVLLWKWIDSRSLKLFVTGPIALLLLALPVADEAWITWNFNEFCKEAGVHVVRKVEVEGYLNDTHRASPDYAKESVITDVNAIRDFDRAGYRFTESLFRDGRARHLERSAEGINVTILQGPTARYVYKHAYQPTPHRPEKPVSWKIWKSEYVISDSYTGEVLGRDTRFIRYPGWIDSLWIHYLGSGASACEGAASIPNRLRGSLYSYVLLPVIKH